MTDLRLIGTWRTDPNDGRSLHEYGDVSMRFEKGGTLVYTVHLPDKEQIVRLTYRVDGDWLVTDQPSSPRQERTRFRLMPDGRLALTYSEDSRASCFVRIGR
jgi:hypothetical protein